MKRIELISSKEYWVETLEAMQQLGHSDYEIATVIADKVVEAINYIRCCESDSEQFMCECGESTLYQTKSPDMKWCNKCGKAHT